MFEQATWLFGYERLCYALNDQPELVDAVFSRVGELTAELVETLVQFDRVQLLFGGDDMASRPARWSRRESSSTKSCPGTNA